jgi:hypothetical protein
VGFLVDKVALGQVFPQYLGFPCQFHSTDAPLAGKNEKRTDISLRLHHKGCIISLKAAVRP